MEISSPAFHHGELIPRFYTRDGEDKSPPLHITEVPPDARSLALIMDDPDAPCGTFTHWLVFDMDPGTVDLNEGHLSGNALQGTSDWGLAEYGGPKPPSGEHRYFFRLYALDTWLNLPSGATRRQIEHAMRGHVIDETELMGRYTSAHPHLVGAS